MIRLYWKNATAEVVGREHGISAGEMEAATHAASRAHAAVLSAWDRGKLAYAELPGRRDYRDQVTAVVEERRAQTSDLVVLGIGGSALGLIALHTALSHPFHNPFDYFCRQIVGADFFAIVMDSQ